ncbi:hypothetical protein NL676_004041 [Syzygium grande]|nr:hypothetical protein NL676_004041 [Syzygium grande]
MPNGIGVLPVATMAMRARESQVRGSPRPSLGTASGITAGHHGGDSSGDRLLPAGQKNADQGRDRYCGLVTAGWSPHASSPTLERTWRSRARGEPTLRWADKHQLGRQYTAGVRR